jgi:DNA-binding NarL/FixJ family response regulator
MLTEAHDEISVLIVEDHSILADALEAALGSHGFGQVRTAASVAASLAAVRDQCPDIVLMDFRLPDGDGTKAAVSIKAHCPSTKVIMLTAEEHDSIVIQAIDAGCSGYLLKNARLEEVVSAVRAVHQGEMLISSAMLARVLPKLSSGGPRTRFELSNRELEVIRLMSEGMANQAIADLLVLSPNTVRNHVQRILTKLGAHSKLEAVAIATRQGLLRLPGI